MTSRTYVIFREAILARRQVVCLYDGHRRELCPAILGHSGGAERVLAFQIGGSSSRGLPRDGAWKCLFVAKVDGAELRDGPWRQGRGHAAEQTCVEIVDLDANAGRRGPRMG